MARLWKLLALVLAAGLPMAAQSQSAATAPADKYALADRIFADYVLDAHIPGLVYGIVIDGQLVHVGTYGVQDLESKRPVTRDSLFRIASMTKAFTALTVLKLRDEGRLRLDAPAADYVPELRTWKYPTDDSPQIRVRDLLNHVAGFVTDDPWGDRQTPLPEAGVGTCDTTPAVEPTGALSGDYTWRCTHGRLSGALSLTPTQPPRIQEWVIEPLAP